MATFGEGGAYSGHLRLRARVDVGDPTSSSTSVTVRLRVYVETDGWNFNDNQTVSYSGWKSGSVNFLNNLSSGDKVVVDQSWSHPVGSTSVSRSFTAKLSGNDATGSSPSVTVNWRVEARPGTPPGPPTTLTVGNIKAHGAFFNWNPPSAANPLPVLGYTLQYRVVGADAYEDLSVPGGNITSRTIETLLERNTRYQWGVRAINSVGTGDRADGALFTTDLEPPAVGGPVEVSSITSTGALISWTIADSGGSGITASRVILSQSVDINNVEARVYDSETSGMLSRTVSGLTRATRYYYWIRIYNGKYWSEWTSTREFTTIATRPVLRPVLTVVASPPTSAQMTWTASGDTGGSAITGYDWVVSLSPTFASIFASGTTTGLTRLQGSLTPGTQYYFRVRAKNAVGDGDWSDVRSLTAPQGVKAWNGTAWVAKPLYYWNGTNWAIPTDIKVWSGSAWVSIT